MIGTEDFGRLCSLLQEKNALLTRYHAARNLEYKWRSLKILRGSRKWTKGYFRALRNQVKNEEINKTYNIQRILKAEKYLLMQKGIFKLEVLRSSVRLETIRVELLEWTQKNRKELSHLKKKLGVRVRTDSHSRFYSMVQGTDLKLTKGEISKRADDFIFEQELKSA